MKVKTTVRFVASNEIEVEVPDGLTGHDLANAIQASLEEHLPESLVRDCMLMCLLGGDVNVPDGKTIRFELGDRMHGGS